MNRKQKKLLRRILIAGAALIAAELVSHLAKLPWWGELLVFLIPYGIIGWDVLRKAGRNILNGQVFDENFLMALATVGALATGEYPEAAAVMLFYQIGQLFESVAVGKSRKSISELMDIRPDHANILRDGELVQVSPEEVQVGDIITVKPGERIPLDGVIEEGRSELDTASLTGESLPRAVEPGMDVVSGCVNISGLLRVRVTKPFGESTVSKILDLVENSAAKKARTENFITRFARYYTPAVVIAAAVLAIIPPLLIGGGWATWSGWIHRAMVFLVISCPCALVISVPLSFFGGIGGAGKRGILVKGGNFLEALAKTEIVVFDKTGTLTQGTFAVTAVKPQGVDPETLLRYAAYAEAYSDHPIAISIVKAYGDDVDLTQVETNETVPGQGVKANVFGKTVLAGNDKLMRAASVDFQPLEAPGSVIYVAADGEFCGTLVVSDQVKPGSAQAIEDLRQQGVARSVMLTGDSEPAARAVAEKLGLDEFHARLMPQDKVELVEKLLGEKTGTLAFVGDGINDAPVLSRADVGIAMGQLGSDAAIEAADIVLMDDDPRKLPLAIRIARKTLRIVYQNIVFALGVKFLVLILGALGLANMWAAVFADVGVSVLAILNAMRAMRD